MPSPLESIRHLSEALFQYSNVDDMVSQVLHTAIEVIGADAGSILLADEKTKQLVFRYAVGENCRLPSQHVDPMGQGYCRRGVPLWPSRGHLRRSAGFQALVGNRPDHRVSVKGYDRGPTQTPWWNRDRRD